MFRAYDAGRERLVAVKLFKLDLPPERVHQLVAAFEQLVAAELSHPAIAVPLATGIYEVTAYLAQDYVGAESIDLAIREYGPAPAADALRVAAQLAGALDFAAVVNVVHGSLHPRDILLSSDETRLTGIGVARALESVGVAAPIRRPYSAPERIAGAAWDRRADIFSLAAVIHELLWGKRITGTGDHAAEALAPLDNADLPTLQRAFARALAEQPADRYETALDFVEALKEAFPGVTIDQHQPAPASRQDAAPAATPPTPAAARRSTKKNRGETEETRAKADAAILLPLEAADRASSSEAELELRPSGHEREPLPRFDDVPREPVAAVNEPTAVPEMGQPLSQAEPPSIVEQSRSAVWPLVAALVIGLALGFAAGYGVGTREHVGPAGSLTASAPEEATTVTGSSSATPSSQPAATAGRDETEVAIGETRKPVRPPEPTVENRVAPPPAPASPPANRTPPQRSRSSAPLTEARRGSTRQPPRPAPPARTVAPASGVPRYLGQLSVDSRPSGARVFLDGRLVGTTPLALNDIRAGEHVVRIERDGYRRWSSSVRIVAAEQNRVTASLER